MRARVRADAQVGFLLQRVGKFLLRELKPRGRPAGRNIIVECERAAADRDQHGECRDAASHLRHRARLRRDLARRGGLGLPGGLQIIVAAGILGDADAERRPADAPQLDLGAVAHDLPVVGRLAIDRHVRRAEQLDGPGAGRLLHQREVLSRDRGFLGRKLHVAVELPPEDDARLA